jgi:hypothetical protein
MGIDGLSPVSFHIVSYITSPEKIKFEYKDNINYQTAQNN